MSEKSKYDVICLERGDIEYIKYVAHQLSGEQSPSVPELKNYAEALLGITRAATDLESL